MENSVGFGGKSVVVSLFQYLVSMLDIFSNIYPC